MVTLAYLWLLAAPALASTAATDNAETDTAAEVTEEPAAEESTNPFLEDEDEPKKKGGGGGLIPVAVLFGFVFVGFCAWKQYSRNIVGLQNATQSPKKANEPSALEAGKTGQAQTSRVDGGDDYDRLSDASTRLSPPPTPVAV